MRVHLGPSSGSRWTARGRPCGRRGRCSGRRRGRPGCPGESRRCVRPRRFRMVAPWPRQLYIPIMPTNFARRHANLGIGHPPSVIRHRPSAHHDRIPAPFAPTSTVGAARPDRVGTAPTGEAGSGWRSRTSWSSVAVDRLAVEQALGQLDERRGPASARIVEAVGRAPRRGCGGPRGRSRGRVCSLHGPLGRRRADGSAARAVADPAQARAHAELGDHPPGDLRGPLEVAGAAVGRLAERDLLGERAAEQAADRVSERQLAGVEEPVLLGAVHACSRPCRCRGR